MTQVKRIQAYTDGSCLGNPGPGGWAALLEFNGQEKRLSGGFKHTTNNRMEVLACIMALESLLEPCGVDLYTDSRYLGDAIEKGWLRSWRTKGWKTADKKPVKNRDLWERLWPLLQRHTVSFHWVAGHSGHAENEAVDMLARHAAGQPGLPLDEGFEASRQR